MDRKLEAVGRLLEVMDELRVKCPWDREQTFQSLRNATIEETFELTDAIIDEDYDNIKKELGDVLLHIVFYSKMGEELGKFDIADVADALCDKLIYRHPHVFGDVTADNTRQVVQNWEDLKIKEREKAQNKAEHGVLSGVPRSLPAMVKAYRIGQKAAGAGFDWEKKEDIWDKIDEEASELRAEIRSGDRSGIEEEFGDLLFAIVNAARLYKVDPEAALERCNRKFMTRFRHIEEGAAKQRKTLREMTLAEMEALWCEAKHLPGGKGECPPQPEKQ